MDGQITNKELVSDTVSYSEFFKTLYCQMRDSFFRLFEPPPDFVAVRQAVALLDLRDVVHGLLETEGAEGVARGHGVLRVQPGHVVGQAAAQLEGAVALALVLAPGLGVLAQQAHVVAFEGKPARR